MYVNTCTPFTLTHTFIDVYSLYRYVLGVYSIMIYRYANILCVRRGFQLVDVGESTRFACTRRCYDKPLVWRTSEKSAEPPVAAAAVESADILSSDVVAGQTRRDAGGNGTGMGR